MANPTVVYKARNDWFTPSSLQRIFYCITEAVNRHTAWLDVSDTKYIELRIDMRTGGTRILNASGEPMTEKDICILFKDIIIHNEPERRGFDGNKPLIGDV